MWLLAAGMATLLVAPHLVPRTYVEPLAGITMWWSALALRVAVTFGGVLVVLMYFPASGLFDLLTRWCLHAVLPFLTTHVGLSGHRLGDAAALVPALFVVISAGSALVGGWQAARSVHRWMRRNVLGPGPHGSLLVGDQEMIVAVAGMREPRVVISSGALAALDEAELNAGLQHEWGHVRRRHRLVTVSAALLLSASRILPGGGSAFRNLQFHLERDADRYAVRTTGDPLALASAICKVAAARATPIGDHALSRLDGSSTSDRLSLLLSGGLFRGRRIPSVIASALAVLTAVLTIALIVALPTVARAGAEGPGGEAAVVCA